MNARRDPTPLGRQLRRIWSRAGIACACFLAAALVLPRVQSALDPQRDRRAGAAPSARDQVPVYVMPDGERRRAVMVVPAEPSTKDGLRGNGALYWWCGILAAATVAGAVAQTMRAYATRDEDDSS
jgi:hypothetical protein